MKRTILFFALYCLFSLSVSGQYAQGGISRSTGIDTTKLQSSIVLKSIKVPANKGFNFETNFWQTGDKNRIRLDTLIFRNVSYNYKYVEIGVSYQKTLMNTVKTNYITSDKFRGWQVVFSPVNYWK
jgi:hypothetical protein